MEEFQKELISIVIHEIFEIVFFIIIKSTIHFEMNSISPNGKLTNDCNQTMNDFNGNKLINSSTQIQIADDVITVMTVN